MDGQEGGYNVDGVEELEDSFTTAGCVGLMVGLT